MKLVQWDDNSVPPVQVLENGDTMVVDCKYWYDLEIGDQIQYLTEIGTSCYFVVDKQPNMPGEGFGEGVYNVTIRAASLIEGVIWV